MNPVQYTTTAIVYPNSRVHVGWGWECLGADWRNRVASALGMETYFATGMDEHSLNVQRAAEAKGLTPQVYCDQMSEDIQKVLGQMKLSYDRFIRTSDADHHRVVEQLIQKSFAKGDIYPAKYEGQYCDGCEVYYTEKDLVNGVCPQHKTPTRFVSEENFFFKLTKYKDALLKLLEDNPDFIRPAFRKGEVLTFIKEVKDFSVSRSTFTWGIPLPFDRKQVIYVWFDALINYLTAAGIEAKLKDPGSSGAREFDARWANVLHVIGKDISRFHCVFWPAMLMSMELPMPKGVFIHGFINMKGEKMSKSLGNYVTPDEVIGAVGVDAFRYYLLAENQFSNDGNFEWEALYLKCNADLANDWGNLVNRTISMARKYFPEGGLKPGTAAVSAGVRESFARLVPELRKRWDEMDPSGYITLCRERSRVLNLFIDQTKPWALAKQTTPEAKAELAEVLATVLEGIRWIATAFLPVLPEGMPKVFEQLGVPVPVEKSALVRLEWGAYAYSPNAPSPIYPRLELAKESPQA